MFRCAKGITFLAILTLLAGIPVQAQVAITAVDLGAHRASFAVTLNGVDVSERSTAYLDKEGTVYVSAADLAAWNLKHPLDPAFTQDGLAYYGLQTQLNLAVSVVRPQERLEIVAPSTAYIGGPQRERLPFTPGGGTVLNYKLDYRNAGESAPATTIGTYNLFLTQNASALQVDYQSQQTSSGVSFVRQLARWYSLDVSNHRVVQVGEGVTNGGFLGSSVQYAGLHIASQYQADPLFITHALPSVEGVAAEPSLVQVFINNVLQWREEVPAGPFVVRDLPASAGNADVILVLTDASGKQTTQIARPSIDEQFLRPGLTSYSLDAGFGRSDFASVSPRYSDPIVSTTLRHGVTPWLTLEAIGESVAGATFGGLGFEATPGFGQQAIFWYGDGSLRRTGYVQYGLNVRRFSFRESLRFNAESRPSEFDPNGLFSRFSETTQLRYNPSYKLSFRLRLDRRLASRGSPTTVLSMESLYRLRNFSVAVRPSYDRIGHVVSAVLELSQTIGETHDVTGTLDRPAGEPAGTSIEYEKQPSDPDDPWSFSALMATGPDELRGISLNDRMPWAEARVQAQDQNGIGNLGTQLNGSLALVGGGLNALRNFEQGEIVGVARLPGFAGVRIDVNGSPAGFTDKSGTIVLRGLSSLQENTITADLSNIPLAVDVKDPVSVLPMPSTPVAVDLLAPRAQSVIVLIVDANGKPLPPASWIVADSGAKFPVGLEGRVYLHGLGPGEHVFSPDGPHPCRLKLAFAPRWEIADAGKQVCR